jgi:hypothetical protein
MKTLAGILFLVLLFSYNGYAQPSSTLLVGTWLGEYTGHDPQTQSDITVRRKLILEATDSIYIDTLWGTPSNSSEIIFETETGTWKVSLLEDSVIWMPTLSQRIDISNPGTLTAYDHGRHSSPIDLDINNEQWKFRDYNMSVDYYLVKNEDLSIASLPSGDTSTLIQEQYTYSTRTVTSSLGHTIEYSFNWGDGTTSDWSTDSTSQHTWDSLGYMDVYVTARCQTHTDKTIISDTLRVDVVEVIAVETDNAYSTLLNCRPNPFSDATTIDYQIQETGAINISVYNSNGQFLETLVNRNLSPGTYQLVWKNEAHRSINKGAYFIVLKTKNDLRVLKAVHL